MNLIVLGKINEVLDVLIRYTKIQICINGILLSNSLKFPKVESGEGGWGGAASEIWREAGQ